MNSHNGFWIRMIGIYSLILGFQGTSLTNMYAVDLAFRMLFIFGGAMSIFRNKVGIYLLLIAFAISIPEIGVGSFYWTPVRLIRFVFGFNYSDENSFQIGIDWVSVFVVSRLAPSLESK